jgi:phosphoglycerate dehydrogenase-like enzyme
VEDRWTAVRLNAVTFPVTEDERSILARAGCRVRELEGTTDAEITAAVADADAVMLVAAYLRAPVIGAMRRCRVISRLGTGVDKIDLDEATRRGIPVTNLPDFCTEEVADHTLALLLAAARQLRLMESSMRAGRQPREIANLHRLSTRTLGIVGFGRIGRAVARRAAAFGMTLLAVDPALSAEEAARAGVEKVDLGAALERSDYLCLLCPLTPATRGMIGMRELCRMRRDSVLVNTARGEIVNETDLAAALRGGVIRYAALDVFAGVDVFAPAGFPVDHPFFGLDNVLLTPHMAAGSEEALADARQRSARAVVEVLEGRAPPHPVNPGVVPWYKGT